MLVNQSIPSTGFVRLPQILSVIPIGKSSWWQGVKAKRYPQAIKLSHRCTVWKAEDIHGLIKQLAEQAPANNRDGGSHA